MALSKKVVAFSLNTTTGNQAITGVGFQPKLVILLCNGTSTGVAAGNGFWSLGAATSSTARWAVGQWHTDGAASSETSRVCRTDKILDVPNPAGSGTDYQADLVSMDSDGFTINIGTTGGVALRCVALCLAGTDLDVAVGSFNTGTTTGVVTAVSGLSFQPKAVLTAHSVTAAGVSATTRQNLGFASGASNEWGAANFESDNSSTMATQHGWVDTRYIYGGSGGAADTELAFNAFASDGWSHDLVAVPASLLICYIAFGGSAQYYVGNDAQKATTGTEALTGVGFQPSALITNMSLRTTTGYDADGDFFTHIGFMDGTSEAGGHVFSDDGTANAETSRGIDETYSLFAVTDDATPTVASKASLSSFDSDGFTVNWNVADATARLFGFLAIGAAASSGTTVAVPKASLVLTGHAPTVSVTSNITVSVPKGSLVLSGYAPTVTVSSGTTIFVPKANLTLTGYAPTVLTPQVVQVPKGGLVLTGYAPEVLTPVTVLVPKGTLTITGYAPTVLGTVVAATNKGSYSEPDRRLRERLRKLAIQQAYIEDDEEALAILLATIMREYR